MGVKRYWDQLSVDWSISGIPKDITENPTCKDFQFNPMILDWSGAGIPSEIRNVYGGRKAALETPIVDWSNDGMPKQFVSLARKSLLNKFYQGEELVVDWSNDWEGNNNR